MRFAKIKKKIIIGVIGICILEVSLLGIETHSYLTNRYSHVSTNGRIVAKLDNIFNFSELIANETR